MIHVITYADKRPDFIPIQRKCIKRFLGIDACYTVINNGSTNELRAEIRKLCKIESIYEYELSEEKMDHSDPNKACAVSLQNTIHYFIPEGCEICVVMDSDMFPVAPFDAGLFMNGYNIAATKQRRGNAKYIWNGLMMFRYITDPQAAGMNFMHGEVEGSITDVGGNMHHFFKKHPEVKIRDMHHTSHIHPSNNNMDAIPVALQEQYDPEFRMEIYERAFLHYGRGSNWDNQPADYHKRKTSFLKAAIRYAMETADSQQTLLPENTFNHKNHVFCNDAWL